MTNNIELSSTTGRRYVKLAKKIRNKIKMQQVKTVKTLDELIKSLDNRNYLTEVTKENIIKAFILSIANGNLSVGEVTVDANKAKMCLFEAMVYGVFAPALKYLIDVLKLTNEDVMENNKKKQEYIGLFKYTKIIKIDGVEAEYVTISEESVKDVYEEMKRCAFTKTNIIRILEDICEIFRRYQEMTIDAAKKIYKVVILFLPKNFAYESLYHISFDLNLYDRTISYGRNIDSKSYVFQDVYSRIQNKLAERVINIIRQFFNVSFNISDERYTVLVQFIGAGPVPELKIVKGVYNRLTGEHMEILHGIKNSIDPKDKKSLQFLTARENKRYNNALCPLRILVEQLLDGYTDEEAYAIIELTASMDSKGTIHKDYRNQLPLTLGKKFYYRNIMNKSDIKVMGYPVSIDKGLEVGNTYHFVNGVYEDSLLDFGKEMAYANGEFKIILFNDRKYAVKDLKPNDKEVDYTKRCFIFKKDSFDEQTLEENFTVGSDVTVDYNGAVKVMDTVIGYIPLFGDYDNKGNSFISLIGVNGVLDNVKVIKDDAYGDTVFFSLSSVSRYEKENAVLPDVDSDLKDSALDLPVMDSNDNLYEEIAVDEEVNLTEEEELNNELEGLKKYL